MITGANGWIGRNACHVLRNHKLVLVDYKKGKDSTNRFGLEEVENIPLLIKEDDLISMNLATQREEFSQLVTRCNPDCVIHLAGVLENQDLSIINQNNLINKNVLEVCLQFNIKVIAASSIMTMYGAAMKDPKIRKIFYREEISLKDEEKLSVNDPFNNTQETIKLLGESSWEKNLTYIKTKERLEYLAKELFQQNSSNTIVLVRFGWTGIRNPFLIEKEGNAQTTETTVYVGEKDLHSFLIKLVDAVLQGKISGCKTYICVSNHPQSWVNVENANIDFGWKPIVNIVEEYKV